MASVNVTNWQAELRTAGALMDIQRTPYVVGTDTVKTNPKKTRQNEVSAYDRAYLLNWPADTVRRIKGSSLLVNVLELETSSVYKSSSLSGNGADSDIFWDDGIFTPYGSFHSYLWVGGDDLCYKNVTSYLNQYAPADLDGDGTLEDYWNVHTYTTSIDSLGAYTISSTVAYQQGAPNTTGTACAYNGTTVQPGGFFSEPNNSIYGTFTNVIYAKEHVDTYGTATTLTGNAAAFCVRDAADSAHGLSAFVARLSSTNGDISSETGFSLTGLVFSARETATESPMQTNVKVDTTCRWYYTPDAPNCDDCWFSGKVVTVDITYKKAALTRTVVAGPGGEYTITYGLGSWSTHSTVTQTLTIPSGLTRQAINAAFDIPTQDGYVVALDDIKLVSVA